MVEKGQVIVKGREGVEQNAQRDFGKPLVSLGVLQMLLYSLVAVEGSVAGFTFEGWGSMDR